ncbi:hypothetical protein GY45DRAFT_1339671 [Cubamyces sp. BRFM 1775]|nr:hypothetical protein GY45DRAFT_1339671 [Cubamyces sp. BRFM 1775]
MNSGLDVPNLRRRPRLVLPPLPMKEHTVQVGAERGREGNHISVRREASHCLSDIVMAQAFSYAVALRASLGVGSILGGTPAGMRRSYAQWNKRVHSFSVTARKLHAFADALHAPQKHERISPLLASSYTELPRAVIQVFGMNPLRDEDLLYARLLRDAGAQTRLNIRTHMERDILEGVRWLPVARFELCYILKSWTYAS